MSLPVRLLLLVLAVAIPAFGAIGYMAVVQRAHAADDARRDSVTLARLAAREHGQLIESTRRLLIGLSHLPAVTRRQPGPCSATLRDVIQPYPYYTNLGVSDPSGEVWCSAVTLSGRVDIADRSYFRRALETGDLGIGEYQVGRITGVPAINFGYPVIDDRGAVRAVVYAAVDLSWLERLTAAVDIPDGSTLTVMDATGIILARYPDAGSATDRSVRHTALLNEARKHDNEGTAEMDGPDGVPRLFAFARLYDGPAGSVYVSVGIPKHVAFAGVGEAFMLSVLVLILFVALAAAAGWAGSRVFVLRPVSALTVAARRLTGGELGARTGLAHGPDALGRLAHSFDDMASTLQRTTRALKTLSAGNQTLVRASEEKALLAEMCRIIVEVGGYRAAWVGIAEQDAGRTIRPVAQAGYEGGLAALEDVLQGLTWSDGEHGRGPAATAVRTGRHCIVHDIAGAPAFAPWRSAAASRGYASVAAFPLHEQGRVTAVLVIYDEETTAFDDKEVEVLAESAADLAFGIVGLRTRDAHHQATETIRRMAYFDTLTGLANHEQFSRSLDGALAGTADVGSPVAVLLLDLNRLREINDAFGFDQGDAVLKEVAARLEPAVGAGGTVARMRGDEFGVLLPGADAERAEQVSQDILGRFRESFSVNGLELDISAAIGIALSPGHSAEAGRLLRHANVAMQQSKAAGLEYAVYRTEKDHDTARRLVLARELRRAIEEDQLVLYYQPKLAMDDERLLGAEALVRWGHPQQGLIPPDEFIPLAEHTGLIQPLTEWVMAAALRESARWREHGLDIPVAVNLSTRNLRDPDLQRKTEHLLTAWAAEPSSLELEITESAIMTDQDRALATLTGLNNLGIKLFVDDFGTGYSSLSYLHKLPVSAVKIDKSFMIGMPDNPDSAAIVRSTIILAHDMGLRVIAEGVEDRRTWDALAAMGCDAAQGYYISRPVPADQFNEWLAAAPSLTH